MKKLTAATLVALALTGCGTPVAPTVAAPAAPRYKTQSWLGNAWNTVKDGVSDGYDAVEDGLDTVSDGLDSVSDAYASAMSTAGNTVNNALATATNSVIAAGNTAWKGLDSAYNTSKTAIYASLNTAGHYVAVAGSYTSQGVSYTVGAIVWADSSVTSVDYNAILTGAKSGVLVACGKVSDVATGCYVESRNGVVSSWNTIESLFIIDGHLAVQAGALRAVTTGKFLSAANGGGSSVTADRTAIGSWETFAFTNLDHAVLQHGDRVIIRTCNKADFWSADNGGGSTLSAYRTVAQSWELFRVNRAKGAGPVLNGDVISLTACNGQYVSVPNGGTAVYCNASGVGPAQQFVFNAR